MKRGARRDRQRTCEDLQPTGPCDHQWLPAHGLPEKAVVECAVIVVAYLDERGHRSYGVSVAGGAPMTTFLGLLEVAQADLLAWRDQQ